MDGAGIPARHRHGRPVPPGDTFTAGLREGLSPRTDPTRTVMVKEASRSPHPLLGINMTLMIIMVPLMVLAIAIAAVPVLYMSVREHNLIHHGRANKPRQRTARLYTSAVPVRADHDRVARAA